MKGLRYLPVIASINPRIAHHLRRSSHSDGHYSSTCLIAFVQT